MRKLLTALTVCLCAFVLLGASACAEDCTNHVLQYYDYGGGQTHNYGCKACGLVLGTSQHVVSCVNGNLCVLCGRNGSIDESIQQNAAHDVTAWTTAAVQHTGTCVDCGETVTGRHFAYCDAADTCAECGANSVVIDEVRHEVLSWRPRDSEWHEYACIQCGRSSDYGVHSTSCLDTSTCSVCGSTDIADYYREYPSVHSADTSEWRYGMQTHYYICSLCHAGCYRESHTGTCGEPCTVCGATDVYIVDAEHDFSYTYTQTHHTAICADCGLQQGGGSHYGTCQSGTACYVCGAENVTLNHTGHEHDFRFVHNADVHYNPCKYCDMQFNASSHYASCYEDACWACGRPVAECNEITIGHPDLPFVNRNTVLGHEAHCSACDATMGIEAHSVSCQDYTTCVDYGCQMTGLTADSKIRISHYPDDLGWRISDTVHWLVCRDCGEEFAVGEHFYPCTAPAGVCTSCGAATTNETHQNLGSLCHDETQHWWICADCGDEVMHELHSRWCDQYEDDYCSSCATQDVEIGVVNHFSGDELGWNETECWEYCRNCNEPVSVYPHVPSAAKPGYCLHCDYQFASMSLSASSVYAEPGQSFKVDVTAVPAGEYTIICTSDAPQTVSVAADGTITAVTAGTARITINVIELYLTSDLVVHVGDLRAATFHAGMKEIEASALLNTAVERLDLSALTDTTFGAFAFAACRELCQLQLPASGAMPDASSFAGADRLVVFCTNDAQVTYATDADLPYVIAR